MKSLKDRIRKEIAHKHLGRNMIGAIAINEIRRYFDDETCSIQHRAWSIKHEAYSIDGYVRFNKIFIKVNDQNIKIEIFKQKNLIMARVNEALKKVGYRTQIVEIFLK